MYSLVPRPSEVISMVLLYTAVSWIMTKQLERSIPIDGAYTRLLCYALNVCWDTTLPSHYMAYIFGYQVAFFADVARLTRSTSK